MTELQRSRQLTAEYFLGQPFFRSAPHDEALARLSYICERGLPLSCLVGESGSGRTMALAALEKELTNAEVVALRPRQWGPYEHLCHLLIALGERVSDGETKVSLWQRLIDRTKQNSYVGVHTVFLCDDASNMDPESLDIWHKLTQHGVTHEISLSTIMVVDESSIASLGDDLLERCSLQVELFPWDESDIQEYIQYRRDVLKFATPIVDSWKVAEIRELTNGNARRIVNYIDNVNGERHNS